MRVCERANNLIMLYKCLTKHQLLGKIKFQIILKVNNELISLISFILFFE